MCGAKLWCLHPCRLLDSFDLVPGHLTEDLHLYSLNDLNATKKGELVPRLTELIKAGTLHVERCMVGNFIIFFTRMFFIITGLDFTV